MNKDEFINECKLRGVCNKNIAKRYVKQFDGNKLYGESDFEDIYRFSERVQYFSGTRGMREYEYGRSTKNFSHVLSEEK